MRKTDISCRRCGYTATVEGKPPERCPGCSVATKPEAVLEFEQKLDALRSQLTYEAMHRGWPIHKLRWRKYPSSDNRLDLMYDGYKGELPTRIAIIRATFEPVSLAFKWVGPEQPTLTPTESALHEKLVEAKQAQDYGAIVLSLDHGVVEPTDAEAFVLTEDEGPSAA